VGVVMSQSMSKEYKAEVAKRSKRSRVMAVTGTGTKITGSFYLTGTNVRPSDFLRNMENKRILLVDASINDVEQLTPVLVIVDNCQYISLLDDFASMVG